MLGVIANAVVQTAEGWLGMSQPSHVGEAWRPDDVARAIARVDALARETHAYAAGFVTYEAGSAFGLAVAAPDERWPLVWFAIFPRDNIVSHEEPPRGGDYELGRLTASVDRGEFD